MGINPEAWPKTDTLPMASKEQIDMYWAQAKAFIKATGFYGSMRWDAECAVAEYIAYQEGYTIRDFTKRST